jgi:hypothetical protein
VPYAWLTRSNAQNDAELRRLIHTQLLSGSLNPELNLTSAQRKKALAGRILELAGDAKLGAGEKAVRNKERNKAAKRVREGIDDKQVERRKMQLEEVRAFPYAPVWHFSLRSQAKDVGNYHPTIKKLFEDSEDRRMNRKREKGIGMGIGKFGGGMLKLTQREIDSVNGVPSSRGGSARRGGFASRGRNGLSSRGRGGSSSSGHGGFSSRGRGGSSGRSRGGSSGRGRGGRR